MLRRLSALAAIALTAAVFAPLAASAAEDVTTRRLAGADRYATAAAIASAAFPDRADGEPRAFYAAVARGEAFPDALAGVNAVNDVGPVLLTPFGDLPRAVSDVLRSLGTGNVTVMGSTDVVSTRVEQQIKDQRIATRRVAGRDRYETAAKSFADTGGTWNFEANVPREVDGLMTAFVTSGVEFADAITAGPVAYAETVPLLLTAPETLPRPTRDALLYDGGSNWKIEQVILVGGPNAVSDSVVREIEALDITVRRVFGQTRQETAIKIFEFAEEEFSWTVEHVNLARGDDYPDAVAGGPHGGEEKAPILLTAGVDQLGAATRDFLRSRSATVASIDVFGSKHAVSDAVVEEARRAATSG